MAKDLVRASDDFGIDESDMMMFMMVIVMMALMQSVTANTTATATAQSVQAMRYVGNVESKILYVTDQTQYWDLVNLEPYTPLISVYLINRGASRVFVAINSAQDWMILLPGETRTISQIGADKRIELVFHRCDLGNTSIVEAEGHF